MRRIFVLMVAILTIQMLYPRAVDAVRYAQCDPCGLCKDTTKTNERQRNGHDESIYIQPANWRACVSCLYPDLFSTTSCQTDELGNTIIFKNLNNDVVTGQLFDCSTLVMAPIPTITPGANQPLNQPKTGRLYSDLGCIEVASGSFLSPDASVDVVQRLLQLITSITGGVGLILILSAALRLVVSRGDPERVREARKTLLNVIVGVLIVLFALLIFRFIAADVLRIPGFRNPDL